jgi:hypothetical protein
MAKVLMKCCKCKEDIIMDLKKEPINIKILASYIGYIICDNCANGGFYEKSHDTKSK